MELYYAPGREDEDADGPEGEYLAGVMLSRVLDEASGTGLRNAHWGLGLRRYIAGDHAWRLDGHFSGTWESSAETPPINFIAALVLDAASPELESFDLQVTMPLRQRGQLVLRGRRYEPPAKSLTFRDRYYSYFASGSQTLVEAGYEDALMRTPATAGICVSFKENRASTEPALSSCSAGIFRGTDHRRTCPMAPR